MQWADEVRDMKALTQVEYSRVTFARLRSRQQVQMLKMINNCDHEC